MCGIVGAMSSILSVPEKETFQGLLNIASFRGRDGSGVVLVGDTSKKKPTPAIRSLKSKLISGHLAYSAEVEALLSKGTTVAIGHARWPTKGGNDAKNLHPHRSDHIVGVHNGTMYDVCGQKIPDNASDSALFFQAIAEKGIEEAWKTSSGAACLVYIDEKEQTVNFIRNGQRPMMFRNYGWNKNISTLFWASESSMLDFVCSRTMASTNHWNTYLPADTVFVYPLDPDNPITPTKTIDLKKPVVSTYVTPYRHVTEGDWEDVDVPFRQGRFVGIDSHSRNNMDPVARADAARKRLAERVADMKTRRLAGGTAAGTSVPTFSTTGTALIPIETVFEKEVKRQLDLDDGIPDFLRRKTVPAGKKCCWCGDPAEVGSNITPVYGSDIGSEEFLCTDCVKNPDVLASGLVTGNERSTVVN